MLAFAVRRERFVFRNFAVGRKRFVLRDFVIRRKRFVLRDFAVRCKSFVLLAFAVRCKRFNLRAFAVRRKRFNLRDFAVLCKRFVLRDFAVRRECFVFRDFAVGRKRFVFRDFAVRRERFVLRNFAVGRKRFVFRDFVIRRELFVLLAFAVRRKRFVFRDFVIRRKRFVLLAFAVRRERFVLRNFAVGRERFVFRDFVIRRERFVLLAFAVRRERFVLRNFAVGRKRFVFRDFVVRRKRFVLRNFAVGRKRFVFRNFVIRRKRFVLRDFVVHRKLLRLVIFASLRVFAIFFRFRAGRREDRLKRARIGDGILGVVRVIRINGADSADFNGVRGRRVEKNEAFVSLFLDGGERRVVVLRCVGRWRRAVFGGERRRVGRREKKSRRPTRERKEARRANVVERRKFSTQRVERLSELRILFGSTSERGGFGVVQTAQRKIDQCRAIDGIHLVSLDKLFYRVGSSSRRALSLRAIFQFNIQARESQFRSLTGEKGVELPQRAVEPTLQGRRGKLQVFGRFVIPHPLEINKFQNLAKAFRQLRDRVANVLRFFGVFGRRGRVEFAARQRFGPRGRRKIAFDRRRVETDRFVVPLRTAFLVDRLVVRDAIKPRTEFFFRVELAIFLQNAHKGRLNGVFGDVAVADATEKVTRQIRLMTAIKFVETTAIGENSVFDQKLFVGVIGKIVSARNGSEGDVHGNLRGAAALRPTSRSKSKTPGESRQGSIQWKRLAEKGQFVEF